mgnify:FL=1|tara:strand:+ start:10971 stop:11192 length:222 start_codon:yes stop_codon:yes gene_type:complete
MSDNCATVFDAQQAEITRQAALIAELVAALESTRRNIAISVAFPMRAGPPSAHDLQAVVMADAALAHAKKSQP